MRKIFMIINLLYLSNLYAGQNWLAQMIAEKERPSVTQNQIKKNIKQQENVHPFFKQHAIVLFYASTCPHCHHLAPVLKAWANQYQANVLALSFDDKPLPDFPRFLPATSEWVTAAFAGQSISYPALFVVNIQTKALYPVSVGSMSQNELEQRMNILIPKVIQYESKVRLS